MSKKYYHRITSLILALIFTFATVIPAFAAPPLNDNFADAEVIASLPLSATVDITEATAEGSEPQYCYYMNNTIWYSFTPTQNMIVRASTAGSINTANINIYRMDGPGINNLSFLGCGSYGGSVTVTLEAGRTYYLQAGPMYFGAFGNIQVNLEEYIPPPPLVNFYYYPSDPSIYDFVSFCDSSYDPAGFGFPSFTWNFGDGTTSTVNCASHKFASDGDYTVEHSATTIDGRSGSSTQVVLVRTHDVSIMRVASPKSATVGQTRSITITIKNNQYPETVKIDLYRSSINGGFEFIASSTQYVPVRSGNRTSEFSFNYTFTPQDAQIGKVTFKAIVSLVNAREAFPADNEAISTPPTVVK